jgi:hypothetical protein
MFGFLALVGLLMAGFAFAAVIGTIFLLLKLVWWAVVFPFRLLFKLLMIPVWLTLGAVGMLAGVAIVPVLMVVAAGVLVVGLVAAVLAVLLPAIPFVLFGLLIWALMRRRPAVVA